MDKTKREFTQAELTASDGRVWTPEECELMAEWWGAEVERMNELDPILTSLLGPDWDVIEDPPAVFILRGVPYRPLNVV